MAFPGRVCEGELKRFWPDWVQRAFLLLLNLRKYLSSVGNSRNMIYLHCKYCGAEVSVPETVDSAMVPCWKCKAELALPSDDEPEQSDRRQLFFDW